jgi:carotenoid cleavage dioxygenase-like enzyme
LEAEVELDSLEVEGAVPDWLRGTLLRNGPGRFEAGETPLRHWFDGLAMLHRFSFDGGRVSYANRFLRTDAYRAAERGDLSFEEFATRPPHSIFRRAAAMLKPEFSDNCSFGVARLGGETIAVTETPVSIAFDPVTLETGDYAYSPPGQHAVAHLHRDPGTGELLGLATRFGARSKYRVYAQRDRGSQRILAEIPVREPSYMHSFGMSERHFLVTACPFVANPLQMGLSGKPFIENFRWEPERGARFLVADRETGRSRGEFGAGAFFAFHHVNVFERGSELVADLIVYDDPGMIEALYLDRLRSTAPSEAVHGRLTRYRIDLDGGGVVEEELCTRMFELPQIDYGRHNGRPYRFVYGAAIDTDTGEEPSDFTDQVIKVDVETGEFATWQSPGSYPGEPVFVPSPRGGDEDEGVLLSVVLDVRAASSYLLVLDAQTLTELGRARVPHHIPFGFHGQYFA